MKAICYFHALAHYDHKSFIKACPCQAEDLWAFAELESCQRCPALCKPPTPYPPQTQNRAELSLMKFHEALFKYVQVIFSGSKPQDFIMSKS